MPVNAGESIGAPPTPVTSASVIVTVPARPFQLVTPPPVASADWTKAVVAICAELVPATGVGAVGVPDSAGEIAGAPPAPVTSAVVRVTAPVRVLNDETPATDEDKALVTNAVVASCVVEVPGAAVGATGIPVNAGLAAGAPPTPVMSASVSVTAPTRPFQLETTLLKALATNAVVASFVVASPAVAVGAVGVPVNAGDARGA
jgi:hypothetical protein